MRPGTLQRGLSLIELMVGLSLGLSVVALVLGTFADHLRQSRSLLAQARLRHDLQTVIDLIAQELRRSGFSPAHATRSVTGSSPFSPIETSATGVIYHWDRNGNGSLDEDETLNFNWSQGRVRMRIGSGTSQELNDPNTVFVTRLTVSAGSRYLPLAAQCRAACMDTRHPCAEPPKLAIRHINLSLEGRAGSGTGQVVRVDTSVRARNDAFQGACPS